MNSFLRSCLALAVFLASGTALHAQGTEPAISNVRGKTVTVAVPAGFDSVTLQRLRPATPARAASWRTVDTQFPRAAATTLTFRLGKLTPQRSLRVFGRHGAPLPAGFFTGVTNFSSEPPAVRATSHNSQPTTQGPGVFTPGDMFNGAVGDPSARAVVESDIWKLAGDRLYFFNQLRGLQVFDVAQPDAPALLGTLRLPAVGEDMYVLASGHAVLLKRDYSWWQDWWFGDATLPGGGGFPLGANPGALATAQAAVQFQSDTHRANEVIVADVNGDRPAILARLPFAGSLSTSRLVGSVLYVAAQATRDTGDPNAPEYGTQVTSFDLQDPAFPVERDSVFVAGWASAVSATDRYFLIANQDFETGASVVEIVDISAPDGAMSRAGSAKVDGYIEDKSKMDFENGVLTAISAAWLTDGDPNGEGSAITVLQTFSLADPNAPEPLGRLEIAPGEFVRATRFDTGRAYVVTFEQVDPLFVVDLSDPANPTVAGHVEAPGFSTFIQPLGDRLVTIGLVNWKPAVSLFDVSDPAHPLLLSQVKLGGAGTGWAQSEAVWDEKAFNILPDQNLILLPVAGYDYDESDAFGGTWFSRVQLIDLLPDALAKRGVIDHDFSPRRAGVVHDRIVSVAPTRVVVANAANRDAPVVTADLEIAWRVDRVFSEGDFLVQLGGSANWTSNAPPTIRVSPAGDPDATLTRIDLPNLPVVGSALRDGVLYVAQHSWPQWFAGAERPWDDNETTLLLSAYDVSGLPVVKYLSKTTAPAPVFDWSPLNALWPSPGTLVFVSDGGWSTWYRPGLTPPTPVGGVIPVDPGVTFDWFSGSTKRFIAFDVSMPEKVRFGSVRELGGNRPLDFSAAFATGGLVLVSARELGAGWVSGDGEAPTKGNDALADRHFLRVIEYTDATAPFLRVQRVNLPGALRGVTHDGRLLYTSGQAYDAAGAPDPAHLSLHASAFDGEAAHLIATFPVVSIDDPVIATDARVLLLDEQPAYILVVGPSDPPTAATGVIGGVPWLPFEPNPEHSKLHALTLEENGVFAERAKLELDHDRSLHAFGDLVVTQPNTQSVRLIDAGNPGTLLDLGTAEFEGWVWPALDNAAGSSPGGLWVPVGEYGIETINDAATSIRETVRRNRGHKQ